MKHSRSKYNQRPSRSPTKKFTRLLNKLGFLSMAWANPAREAESRTIVRASTRLAGDIRGGSRTVCQRRTNFYGVRVPGCIGGNAIGVS